MSMTPRQMPVTLFMFFFMELANSPVFLFNVLRSLRQENVFFPVLLTSGFMVKETEPSAGS